MSSICVFFIISIPFSGLEQFYLFPFPVCLFVCFLAVLAFFKGLTAFLQLSVCVLLDFCKGFIRFFFRGLYHLHKIGFKVIFLRFVCVGISRACYSRIPGFWWCHTALAVLIVFYTGLGLGFRYQFLSLSLLDHFFFGCPVSQASISSLVFWLRGLRFWWPLSLHAQ